jgi:hypothetical protein
MALTSTQPLTIISARNLLGSKKWSARKANNLTAICEPVVLKKWEPQRLTILWASTACYRDSFTFFYVSLLFHLPFLIPSKYGNCGALFLSPWDLTVGLVGLVRVRSFENKNFR